MSFSWPVALKQSALRRLSVLDGALLPTTEEIVGEIDPKGKWLATVSLRREVDGKFVSLLVREPIFCPCWDKGEGDNLPGFEDSPAVYFAPAECEELDLRVVARLRPHWELLSP